MPLEIANPESASGALAGLRPLIATDDADLLDDLLRLAAAAGVDPQVATTLETVRARWNRQSLILLGADFANELKRGFVPRRGGVILTTREVSPADDFWQAATALGAEQVALLPAGEPWLVDRISAAGTVGRLPAPTVGVIAGCGGGGASVLTAGLARAAADKGLDPVAIDLDFNGAGIDVFLAAEGTDGLSWHDFANARGRLRGDTVMEQLPSNQGIAFVGWHGNSVDALSPGAVGSVIDAVALSSRFVVVDLPRSLGEAAWEALCRIDLLLVVTPQTSVGALSTARLAASPALAQTPTALVVRGGTRGPLTAEHVADAVGIPLLLQMADDTGVARRLEQGLAPSRGRGPLAKACRRIVTHILDDASAARHPSRQRDVR